MSRARTTETRPKLPPHAANDKSCSGILKSPVARNSHDPTPGVRREQLTYLADMIDELASIAHRLDSTTLAGILDLAKREALLERSRV